MNAPVNMVLVVSPIPRTSQYFRDKDYKPKYHPSYDPTQAMPRVIDAPIEMETAEIKEGVDE